MELQEFIKNTLTSIVNGLNEANQSFTGKANFKLDTEKGEVHFDIAITVSEEDKKSGGAGIKVYALKLGGEKEISNIQESVSRIQFKVIPSQNIS